MMRTKRRNRKAALKIALAVAGQTAEAWCEERGISTGHFYQVLGGKRESARLTSEIDAFIAQHTPQGARVA